MKRSYAIIPVLLLTASLWAQSPQKMSFQAIIRNSSDQLVVNHVVGMRISILLSSPTGTSVYVETQTPTTNENGVASLEIGGGNIVTGSFAAIDWSSDMYFIKTETDPTGGTSYTITGTSQLLSVPYVLYSKTAGSTNATGGHYIGELYGGGVIFYVDKTGQHGFICSMIDLFPIQKWSNILNTLIGTTAQSTWDGLSNSNAIVGQSGHTNSPAKVCLDYTNDDYGTGIYSDWYLPAIDQLNLLYNAKYQVNKALESDGNFETEITKNRFWSSSELSNSSAKMFDFYDGTPGSFSKNGLLYIHAIRSF
jgi:hypothetical protein